ncbi:MAG: protein-glutamate O-methyltransferase CheR [Acidipila sp.]|nr:protein-glutamate O-methyltransferase CheR [Acidipila sp.]
MTLHLKEAELNEIRTLIEQRSGILFDASRQRFFSTRVREYVQERGLADGAALLRLVRSSNVEYDEMLQSMLTQETSFYRYPAVIDALVKKVLPEVHARKFWENPRTLRIWSAGCSTGEEPYSIAIALAENLEFVDAWNIEILATDISQQALRFAERGVYPQSRLGNLTPGQMEAYFARGRDGFSVKPRIRKMVSFETMNLAQAVYVGRLDCIFCMNVLMYFSEERRNSLIQRFYEYLEPGGYLLLGHAESVSKKAGVKFESIRLGDCILNRKPAVEVRSREATVLEGSL